MGSLFPAYPSLERALQWKGILESRHSVLRVNPSGLVTILDLESEQVKMAFHHVCLDSQMFSQFLT